MRYSWKRFWCPRGASVSLQDGGYVYDPESQYGNIINPDVVSFNQISDLSCLVLLGDPGLGKSTALEAERTDVESNIRQVGNNVLFLDLKEYSSEDRLVRDCFENETFRSWEKGSNALYLFLDSLDECRLEIKNITNALSGKFRLCKPHASRLKLRIACRTAEWPGSLESTFHELWPDEQIGIYELVPLRRCDVIEAATVEGLVVEKFLAEVTEKQAEPLAINPTTLRFLINVSRRDGRLPDTRADLFAQGCQLLCDELSESRRDSRHIGVLSSRRRFAIAARIAAVSVFCGKSSIFIGSADSAGIEEDLRINDLEGGTESVGEESFGVGEADIREVLGTALFSGRGLDRLGFTHKTYAEFLAARYLAGRRLQHIQTVSLIQHPGDSTRKVVPQLGETVAWLCSMDRNVFQSVIRSDPHVLLRSDVAKADNADKEAIVSSLLSLFDAEELDDSDWDLRWHYQKLKHPRLSEQIKPYISDCAKYVAVRRLAIDLAEACKELDLQGLLVDVALDQSDNLHIRDQAAHAVIAIGDDASRLRLMPLVRGEAGDDPDDQLRGNGMRAVWPRQITAKELFDNITPPKRGSLSGAYSSFLIHDLVPQLVPMDLATALQWCCQQDLSSSIPQRLSFVVKDIVKLAWKHLDTPDVLSAFTQFMILCLQRHPPFWHYDEDLKPDTSQRRRLLSELVLRIPDFDKYVVSIVFGGFHLVEPEDFSWLVDQVTDRTSEAERWAKILGRLPFRDTNDLDSILTTVEASPALAKEYSWLVTPVRLDSTEAENARKFYNQEMEIEERMKESRERPLLSPPPKERIEHWLTQCESGNSDAWWILNRELQLEPNSTHYLHDFEPDLTVLPGWRDADEITRTRIVQAGETYLLLRNTEPSKWLGTNTVYYPDLAGYRALVLVSKKEPAFLDEFSNERWSNWASTTLGLPIENRVEGSEELQRDLVCRAYSKVPDIVIAVLLQIIEHENQQYGHLSILRKIEKCWDEHLSTSLLEKVQDETLNPSCFGDLLAALIKHDYVDAQRFAETLVCNPLPTSELARTKAIEAAVALLSCAPNAGWNVLWPAFQGDPEFGKSVVTMVAHEERHLSARGHLTEQELSDYYIWLSKQYPHADDPNIEGAHSVSSRESITLYRENILQFLKAQGTQTGCEAIQRIVETFPDIDYLKWVLRSAKQQTLRLSWRPPTPHQFFELTKQSGIRLVQNADELLSLIIESLESLQRNLQGETPAVRDIWDRQAESKKWRPVDENDLSDYVTRYLRQDLKQRGIVALREVKIRRGRGKTPGEETDIYVSGITDGIVTGTFDTVRVVIETKGCWNKDLLTAMETQLVKRYLRENDCQHGLYLVGWFNCAQWIRLIIDANKLRNGRSMPPGNSLKSEQ